MSKKWSKAEIKRLQELTEAGYPDRKISKKITDEFGYERTQNAVQSKRLNLGLKKTGGRGKNSSEDMDSRRYFDCEDIKKVINKEELDYWSEKNILALNYLTSRGVPDERIAKLIEKKPEEVRQKREELKKSIKRAG